MGRPLHIERLSIRYAASSAPAVDRLSWELPAGGSLAVLGPPGAGKTSLLSAIAGLLQAHQLGHIEGVIRFGGHAPDEGVPGTAFPAVALVPQDPRHVISGFVPTVREECQLTLRQAGVPEEDWALYLEAAASSLHIDTLLDRSPNTLSGGELQAVAVAIMATARPSLLLLDEPVASLDQDRIGHMTRFVIHRPRDYSIVIADTVLHPVVLACESVLVLERGREVFRGPREEFWARLPEFQDLVQMGDWLEVRRTRPVPEAAAFQAALEAAC